LAFAGPSLPAALIQPPDKITVPVITIAAGDQRSFAAGNSPALGETAARVSHDSTSTRAERPRRIRRESGRGRPL